LNKPDHLIIIGAQRSGTTFLYGILDAHPHIHMAQPVFPEPKFFLSKEGLSYEDYIDRYFHTAKSDVRYLGEKSASYYERQDIIPRIKEVLGNPKIIIQLRNPVERALSNYHFSVKNGLETRSLHEVFIQQVAAPELRSKISVDPFDYLGRGQYLKFVKAYKQAFKDDLLVLKFEDTVSGQTGRLWDWLGLDSTALDADREVNKNGLIRKNENREVAEWLQEYYKRHNEELETFLGEDFGIWK